MTEGAAEGAAAGAAAGAPANDGPSDPGSDGSGSADPGSFGSRTSDPGSPGSGTSSTGPSSSADSPPPARVRVTAPSMAAAQSAGAASARSSRQTQGGADALFVRSLIRSQLRLAVVCALGFCAVLVTFAVAIGVLPQLDEMRAWGVPVSWLLLGFGVYPIVLVTALIYVAGARRNEAGYLALTEDG